MAGYGGSSAGGSGQPPVFVCLLRLLSSDARPLTLTARMQLRMSGTVDMPYLKRTWLQMARMCVSRLLCTLRRNGNIHC